MGRVCMVRDLVAELVIGRVCYGPRPRQQDNKTMGFLRRNLALVPRHTKEVAYKHWFDLSSIMQHLFGIPITNFRFKR